LHIKYRETASGFCHRETASGLFFSAKPQAGGFSSGNRKRLIFYRENASGFFTRHNM
jgi:hypothetical protein